MKVKRITALLLSLFIIIFSGCTENKVVNEKPEDTIGGKITIWSDKESLQILKLSIDSFKKLHNKADIKLQEIDNENLYLELKKAVESSDAVPDIIVAGDEEIQLLLKNYSKNFMDTSSIIKKENYLRYKTDNVTKDGKLLGIPLSCKPAVLMYRKDILSSAGINPEYIKTWADLIASGQTIFQKQKINMLAAPLNEESTYRMFLNQLGASYFDKSGNVTVNSPEAVKAADMLKLLFTQGTIENVNTAVNVIDLLKQGKTAAVITDYEEVNKFIKTCPEFKDKLGVMKLPAFEEGGNQSVNLGGDNLLLLSSTADKTLTTQFSKFLTEDRDNLKMLLEEGAMLPANTSFYDEVWFSKKEPYFGDIKLWKLLSENAQDMYGINYSENFSVVAPAIQDILQTIIIKGNDSKAALEDLEKKFQIVKG